MYLHFCVWLYLVTDYVCTGLEDREYVHLFIFVRLAAGEGQPEC